MYDIIIIGAGPAGLTAAIYAKRANKNVLVLEAINYGGQIVNILNIDNYPGNPGISGFELATNLYNQVKNMGVEIRNEKVLSITEDKKILTNKEEYQAKSIIIAAGSENRKLRLENEKELTGKGISYCATCDGAFYKDKVVAVVGGGNTAVYDALYLSDIVNKVYLIHRKDILSADEAYTEKLQTKGNIEIVYNSIITKINGVDKLENIEIKTNDEIKLLNIDGLFVAIGKIPENENFKNIINVDEKGYVIADENCHTNVEGIFVAGDIRTKSLRQLVTATSDGAVAATEAIKYIKNK